MRVLTFWVDQNPGRRSAPENVLAVWYASLQLLAVAALAILCFVVDRRTDASARVLPYGWLGLAVVFFGFSLDELGSLHERIGSLGTAAQPGLGWTLLLVFLTAVGGGAVAFAGMHLRRHRLPLALMALGVTLFATVPLQELAEGSMRALAATTDGWRRPTHYVLLEEGSELIATLCFLAATAAYAAARSPRHRLQITVSVEALVRAAVVLVVVLGGLMVATQLFMWHTVPGDAGRPNNWFAGVMAAVAAGTSYYLGRRDRRGVLLAVALVGALFSVYVGANLYGYLYYETYDASIERFQTLIGVVLVLAVLALGFLTARRAPSRWNRAGSLAWALLLVGAMTTPDSRLIAPLAFGSFAVLLLSLPHWPVASVSAHPQHTR